MLGAAISATGRRTGDNEQPSRMPRGSLYLPPFFSSFSHRYIRDTVVAVGRRGPFPRFSASTYAPLPASAARFLAKSDSEPVVFDEERDSSPLFLLQVLS